jgi:peptide methionine sulfoxide reductase msrA/msrB
MSRKIAIFSIIACVAAVAVVMRIQAGSHTVEPDSNEPTMTAVMAGGCFWCTESDFAHCPGVIDVVVGFSGGTTEHPNYSNYHNGHHTECSLVTYDPKQVTFAGLVEWLVKHIDPTDPNGQFFDRGDGYKPVVFYENEKQKVAAQKVFDAINAKGVFNVPLQIELRQLTKFWPAGAESQDYHKKAPALYKQYRSDSGRNTFIKKAWGKKANILELPGSIPRGAVSKAVVESDEV